MEDQFTDIGVFPDLCMDSMLPPGMARASALGLDKCEMGIELGFRKNHHHHHTTVKENKYNDQWIRNWQRDVGKDAAGFQKSLSQLQAEDRNAAKARNDLRSLIGSQVSGLKGDVSGLDRKLGQTLGNVKSEYAGQVSNLQDIFGERTKTQQAAWDSQAKAQQAQFADQLKSYTDLDKAEAERWETRFAGAQIARDEAMKTQKRDLQASINTLGTDFQADLLAQRESVESGYQSLVKQAKDDAEIERLKLANEFQSKQFDQQAAFHKTTSDLASKDRVFDTQIGELQRDLGVETDRLGASLASLGQSSAAARQQLGSQLTGQQQALQQNVTGQLGGFRQDITEYKSNLAEQKEAQDAYYEANKRHRELQIQDAERARTAASYASAGTALNKQVKGVRRAGTSRPGGIIRSRSPRQSFNRSGLRISSLNI